jgi:hypothetical protein
VGNAHQGLLGSLADTKYDALPDSVRQSLGEYGILDRHWDMARQGQETMADGKKYFSLDPLDARVAENPFLTQAAQDTKDRFHAMFHNAMSEAINEPQAREGAVYARRGTLMGEVARAFWQFKGFVKSTVGRHFVPAAMEAWQGVRTGNFARVGTLAQLMALTTMGGYLSMVAKQLSRGEKPKTIDDVAQAENVGKIGATWRLWGSAFAQGGGLGMYGDFLFGEMDRNGKDFTLSSIGGPGMSQAEQVAQIVRQAISGGDTNLIGGKGNIPGELIHLASSNIPIINTWYTRLALDKYLLWPLQEHASPGYLQKYQSRQEDKAATRYWLAPTSAQ